MDIPIHFFAGTSNRIDYICVCIDYCAKLQNEDGSFPLLSDEERAWLSLIDGAS